MSNYYIFLILLILTLIILYGGQNKQKLVIYNNEYFCFIKNMEIFYNVISNDEFYNKILKKKYENKITQETELNKITQETELNKITQETELNKITQETEPNKTCIFDIVDKFSCFSGIFTNLQKLYFVKIFPNDYLNVYKYFNNNNDNVLMTIYTHSNYYKKLKLLVNYKDKNAYFLDINNNTFITNPYIIYNKSNISINFILLFFSKPFWFY
jgi:hypothetical protein